MGDDRLGNFDEFKDIFEIVYIKRTNRISTTSTIDDIKKDYDLRNKLFFIYFECFSFTRRFYCVLRIFFTPL